MTPITAMLAYLALALGAILTASYRSPEPKEVMSRWLFNAPWWMNLGPVTTVGFVAWWFG